jgi:hypothetical protein
MSAPALEHRVDELYREHPDGFVARRNQLVKELRSAGDRDAAERVKKLRRPSLAAWLINLAALSSPAAAKELAEASRQLEKAQARALQGADDGGDAWRAAAAREREATGALVEAAEGLAREAGHPPSAHALDLVGETLRSASADPELRERVLRGRVERERSAATLGTPAVASPPRRTAKAARRRAQAEARRELERLEAELTDSVKREELLRERVKEAEETLRHERSKLADGRRTTAELRRQVKAAERRARR